MSTFSKHLPELLWSPVRQYALARFAQICAALGSAFNAANKHSFATLTADAWSKQALSPAFAPAPENVLRKYDKKRLL